MVPRRVQITWSGHCQKARGPCCGRSTKVARTRLIDTRKPPLSFGAYGDVITAYDLMRCSDPVGTNRS